MFIIDPEAKIRTILYYPLSTGRNFDEIKRIILALQKADKDNVATPADWRPGDDVIIPTAGSCGTAKERMESQDDDMYCLDWFMCFRREKNNRVSATGGRLTIFIDKLENSSNPEDLGRFYIFRDGFIIPGLLIPDRYS